MEKTYVHFIDKTNSDGVRPIALTSCLCKLFESLIKNRLEWWCEFYEILPMNHTGFKKGRSCTGNITNLTMQINEAFLRKNPLLAAFLDVSGAFDNVNFDILLEKLANI